jgi:hypothetical protein
MAAITISVRGDWWKFRETLDDLARNQLPYASALALNETARAVKTEITRELPSIFNAKRAPPTPFTMHAIGTARATKSNLVARVFVKDWQAKYLGIEETGGERMPAPGAPVLVPVDIDRNQYGNIPRGMVRRLAGRKDVFLGTVQTKAGPVYGLWQRLPGSKGSGRLKLLAAFRERAEYKPRFGFERRAAAAVGRVFMPALERGMAKALATAIRR